MPEPTKSEYPFDPEAAVQHLSAVEPAFRAALQAVGPFSMLYDPMREVFPALLRAIVYQQLSGKAASTIHSRVVALFDGTPRAQKLGELSDEELRGAGLSRAKLRAARDLAEHDLGGKLPSPGEIWTMPDQEIRDALTRVKGVGPWTVDMLLIFRLGRPDVLPLNDLGIKKGFARLKGLAEMPDADTLDHGTRPWTPWRSVASWYLWRLLDVDLPEGES